MNFAEKFIIKAINRLEMSVDDFIDLLKEFEDYDIFFQGRTFDNMFLLDLEEIGDDYNLSICLCKAEEEKYKPVSCKDLIYKIKQFDKSYKEYRPEIEFRLSHDRACSYVAIKSVNIFEDLKEIRVTFNLIPFNFDGE